MELQYPVSRNPTVWSQLMLNEKYTPNVTDEEVLKNINPNDISKHIYSDSELEKNKKTGEKCLVYTNSLQNKNQ